MLMWTCEWWVPWFGTHIHSQMLKCLSSFLSLLDHRPGSVHKLEESDGGSVSVSDIALLRETLHWPRVYSSWPRTQLLSPPHLCQVWHTHNRTLTELNWSLLCLCSPLYSFYVFLIHFILYIGFRQGCIQESDHKTKFFYCHLSSEYIFLSIVIYKNKILNIFKIYIYL